MEHGHSKYHPCITFYHSGWGSLDSSPTKIFNNLHQFQSCTKVGNSETWIGVVGFIFTLLCWIHTLSNLLLKSF